jgi:nucleotide-binding universal stress UspA family protein
MTLRKIVVGVDETPAAMHALREAAHIAAAAGAELFALAVVHDPWQRVAPQEVEGHRRFRGPTPADLAERHTAEALSQLVDEAAGAGHVRLAVRFGLPGIELARWSEEVGADLLVLGRQPPGDLGRRPAGRTVAGTLARSRVPCLLVPFGQRTWRRVVAAVGNGPAASAVESAATKFASLWKAEPICVHAEPSSAGATAFAAARAEGGASTAIAATVVSGDPVGEVLKVVREHEADTLVIGYHHGETAAERGRVAPQLLERAPCAVLTVPV